MNSYRLPTTGTRGRLAAALLTLTATWGGIASADGTEGLLHEDLRVQRIAPGVWMHVSYRKTAGGRIGANGLVVATGELSVLIDTGWSPDQARRIAAWAETTLGQPVEHVILTHGHADRAGGLPALLGRELIVEAHAGTASVLARPDGSSPVDWLFEFEERIEAGGETVDLYYPGAGHTRDNIVVWLPRRRILFGGCLIKSVEATGLGYVGDADLETWPLAVRRIIERYREAEIVVPGHGNPGGVELLSRTMELLEAAGAQTTAP